MRTNFIIPSNDGTYLSQIFEPSPLSNFINNVSFAFYDDIDLTIPSVGMTGTFIINANNAPNTIWQNIPNTSTPSSVNVALANSLIFEGTVYQFQIITNGITNTNYINIIYDISFPK